MSLSKIIEQIAFKTANFCFSVFPLKRNRVFFISFFGKSYSDNPKAISKALYKKYGDKFEHVWVLDHPTDDVPEYVRTCKYNSLKMLYYMSTAKVWVSNSCMWKNTYKRHNQYYIQTWHGDRGFKRVLLEIENNNHYVYETDHADLMTSGSEFGLEHYYRNGFAFKGEIMMEGSPRNDIFFQETSELQQRIRMHYSISPTDKVVMFAPTFRKKYRVSKQEVTLDLETVRKTLEQATAEHWVVLVRSHVANAQEGMSVSYNKDIISVTDYPDMNELLQITDILISDYSSSIGDFALSGRLCLLYQDDIEDYTNQDRALVFNMADSPFLCAHTPDEMYALLARVNDIDAKANSEAINRFYGITESGHSSDKVAEKIERISYGKS